MKELVTKEEFARATQLERFGMAGVAGPLMRLNGLARINRIYNDMPDIQGEAFIHALLERMEVEVEWEGRGLSRIPEEGPFITISNHPFGTWDGLILLKGMLERRPDFKVLGNAILTQVNPVAAHVISGSTQPDQFQDAFNVVGFKRSLEHLQAGGALGMFPAGEVSTFQPKTRTISDHVWQRSAIKLIEKADVPVIPVYFQGGNSPLFHLMGMIHPALQNVRLPKETLKRKQSTIQVRVGSPITTKEIRAVHGVDRLGRYLRARTYSLGTNLEVNNFFKRSTFQQPKRIKPLASEQPKQAIAEEFAGLADQYRMCDQAEFEVFCVPATEIPHALAEIGRLREVTFRAVGEGTGHEKDLDEYDLYYYHLILWDKDAQQIAGAYRMGPGDLIMQRYGKKGFYTYSLFRMQDPFNLILRQSVELGRSFILADYQKKRLPLYLLWKGIYNFLQAQPQYRYLIGPVSISNDYSNLSKGLIVSLIERFFWDAELARYIQPRKRFKPKLKRVNPADLIAGIGDNLKRFDRLIEEIEPRHFRLPILLKKYIRQNARIIGFNVDPAFNNALDGFMIMDLQDIPEATEENMNR